MIISAASDYRAAAQRILPPFLFHYMDGGAYSEYTLRRNVEDLSEVALRQRILKNMSDLSLETTLFNEKLSMPVALAPVGLCGMYARRGEVQAAKAADAHGIPFTLSTVSVCPIEEVAPAIKRPMWFQLYVLRDRGFMRNALERAKAAGCSTLVFTVDMPTPGARYRDAHSGMSGPNAAMRRYLQAVTHPQWAWDVGLNGRPHDLGNISAYLGKPTGLEDYIGWLGNNFDPSISWKDLEWIRDFWDGPMVIKGILDPEDARDAVRFGADGIVVSNHGGRQLDGVLSSARALPAIADAVKGDIAILADSGIRNGLDVVRMIALGADTVLLGRAFLYALATAGQAGVANLLNLIEKEMKVAMTLTGAKSISEITQDSLVQGLGFRTIDRSADHYGLSLILGGAEITLWDLTAAYMLMAAKLGGQETIRRPHYDASSAETVAAGDIPLSRGALWLMFEAISRVTRPEEEGEWQYFASSKKIGWKTGTSYGNRDAWAVGATPDYAVGVWVGNCSGEGRPLMTGVGYAAPVLFEVFGLLPGSEWFAEPYDDLEPAVVCRQSGFLASQVCPDRDTLMIPRTAAPGEVCPYHRIVNLSPDLKYRVTTDCCDPARIVRRPMFILPPAQEWYYRRQHPDYRPLPPLHPGLSGRGAGNDPIEIIYPQPGRVLVAPKSLEGRQQSLVFTAVHRDRNAVLFWHLDDRYLGATSLEHKLSVRPAPGRHRLTVIDEHGASRSVAFSCR